MKRGAITILAIGLLLVAAPIVAHATDYTIDPSHTAVTFSVRHMMISNVRGEFEKTSGTISANGTDPNSVKIDVTIDASSINTRVDRRDAHLKSPDFLEVDKFPTITFKSTKVEAGGIGQMESQRQPHASRRDQRSRARRDRSYAGDHRSDGQHARGSFRDGHDQPQGFRADLEQGHRERWRGGRR